jgi:hypothetical protein
MWFKQTAQDTSRDGSGFRSLDVSGSASILNTCKPWKPEALLWFWLHPVPRVEKGAFLCD